MTEKEELIELCDELQLSVRINSKSGAINLYEDLGEFECAEQAILYLRKRLQEYERLQ